MYEKLLAKIYDLIPERREASQYYTARVLQESAVAIEQLQKDLERSKEYEAFWEKEATEALKKFQVTVASKPRWIPVTERLPENDGEYLSYIRIDDNEPFLGIFPFDSNVPAFGRWEEYYDPVTYGWAGSEFIEITGVTHWMPLPEPPKEEQADPCSDCRHYPPSSTDGKPCCACDPSNPLTNCHDAKEET